MMRISDTIVVTGGTGFIGSDFVLDWIKTHGTPVVNFDALTYAGNLANLDSLKDDPRLILSHGDICNTKEVAKVLRECKPRAVVHFAAESHVDRSIVSPDAFIRANIQGTFTLLEQAKSYWSGLDPVSKSLFRFLHVAQSVLAAFTSRIFTAIFPAQQQFHPRLWVFGCGQAGTRFSGAKF